MKRQFPITLFLIIFCVSCQKESKNFPTDIAQLRKIENNHLFFEFTYLNHTSIPKATYIYEFELSQNNTQLKLKNTSKSDFSFSSYFIGTGCEG